MLLMGDHKYDAINDDDADDLSVCYMRYYVISPVTK